MIEWKVVIKLLLAKPRSSERGYARGGGWEIFKYFKFPLKIGMFPMTPVKGRVEQCLAHRITSPMGWGCREPALNSRMKSSAVKAGGTGEASPFRAG